MRLIPLLFVALRPDADPNGWLPEDFVGQLQPEDGRKISDFYLILSLLFCDNLCWFICAACPKHRILKEPFLGARPMMYLVVLAVIY